MNIRHMLVRTALLLGTTACGLRAAADATSAYIFGYPLVLFDATREAATTAPFVCGMGAPPNAFAHLRAPPGPDFRGVVRPNVDTLYSSAFVDLTEGPVALDMPGVADRYVLMAVLDSRTENIAGLGTPTHGAHDGHYLLVGPDGVDEVAEGRVRVDVPTRQAWLIGRTQILASDTLAPDGSVREINDIQDRYLLSPMGRPSPGGVTDCVPPAGRVPPGERVDAFDGATFFGRLDRILREDPSPGPVPGALQRLGIGKGEPLTDDQRRVMDVGVVRGRSWLERIIRYQVGGRWGPSVDVPLGRYDDRTLVRAVVARVGFGANRNEYALYQNAGADGRGKPLDGQHVYTLTFPTGEEPPVDAFWSVTVYGPDGFLVDHPVARHALGSESPVVRGDDGALVLTFANHRPLTAPESNWLPVPEGPFEVTLRLYAPAPEALDGRWRPPELERLDP